VSIILSLQRFLPIVTVRECLLSLIGPAALHKPFCVITEIAFCGNASSGETDMEQGSHVF
jgi:hypothetical protein